MRPGRARRLPRRGDEREGGDGPLARRPRDRGLRHAYARPDERRARAAGRDGGDHGRGDDGPARLGDRRQGRARDPADAHRDARAVRDGRGRHPPRGRARRVRRLGRATSCEAVRVVVAARPAPAQAGAGVAPRAERPRESTRGESLAITLAASLRAEAEDVIRRAQANEPPFCDPWPEWRPDPSWGLPRLPDGWDRVAQWEQQDEESATSDRSRASTSQDSSAPSCSASCQ